MPRPVDPSLELPELDKSEDAGEVDVGELELSLGDEVEFDDAGADAIDAFEVQIQEQSDPGSSEAAGDLDIGNAGLVDLLPEPLAGEDDELAAAGDELDAHLEIPLETDEPSTDAELGDDGLEALPELVVVDDDGDEGPELDGSFLAAAPEGRIAQGPSFEPEWLLLAGACSALAAAGEHVLACSEQLLRFGAERASLPLPHGARPSVLAALPNGGVALCTTRGLLEVSAAGTASFPEPPEQLRGSGARVAQLAGTPGAYDLWARLSNGALLRRRDGAWERHEAGGAVRALSGDAEHLCLLVVAERPTLQLSSDAGHSFVELLLPEPAAGVASGAAPMALVAGRVIAVADAERGLCVSNDAGLSFTMVTGGVNVTAVALGRRHGEDVVFAALHREGPDTSELILVDPATGHAGSIAELAGEPDEEAEETGRTHALLFSGGYLWAAGGYGLAKLKG